jgi:hypothetical protein
MYDRLNDFNVPPPVPRNYFNLPKQEIYFFYSNTKNAWVYEFLDNSSFCLKTLNKGHGQIMKFSTPGLDQQNVYNYLLNRYPEADIDMYACEEDWFEDVRNLKFF